MRMKLFCFFVLSLIAFGSYAQQLGNIQRGQRGYAPPIRYNQTAFVELREPYEDASRIVKKSTEVFGLDDFQQQILKNMLIKKFEDENAILENEANNSEDRKKQLLDRDNIFLSELSAILSPEQIEQFKAMDFSETREDKKEKKKKKRRAKKNRSR